MKRTISPANQAGFFPKMQRTTKVISDINKAEEDIEKYIFSKLKEAGYGAKWIDGVLADKQQKKKEHENWSMIEPRILLRETGLLLEIFSLDNPKYAILVQPFVITSAEPQYVKNLPRYNLTSLLLKELEGRPKDIHIKIIHNLFFLLDLHFLVMTETGQFWLDKYSNINEKDYMMTWRKSPSRLDRICVRAGAQEGKFHSTQKDLKDQLQTFMYYFNKNNKYDNQQKTVTRRTRNS